MRLGGKTTAGMTLVLGVIVGLGLVTLPGILAPPAGNSTSTNSTSRTTPSAFTASSGSQNGQNGQPTKQPPAENVGYGLAVLAGLVLFPAVALSILVRRWTLNRARSGSATVDSVFVG